MIWTAIIQYLIYSRSECGRYASGYRPDGMRCANADIIGGMHAPSDVRTAVAEILASITSLEYSYSKAPANMKSMVQAVALSLNAISSSMGLALATHSSVSP